LSFITIRDIPENHKMDLVYHDENGNEKIATFAHCRWDPKSNRLFIHFYYNEKAGNLLFGVGSNTHKVNRDISISVPFNQNKAKRYVSGPLTVVARD